MPILNYTTTINADKTVGEIQTILARAGASRILIEYAAKTPNALAFELDGVQYRLPCRADGVYAALRKDGNIRSGLKTHEQALRVAWRVIKDWTEAQLAIIEAELVDAAEVFLPYRLVSGGETVYQVMLRSDRLLVDSAAEYIAP